MLYLLSDELHLLLGELLGEVCLVPFRAELQRLQGGRPVVFPKGAFPPAQQGEQLHDLHHVVVHHDAAYLRLREGQQRARHPDEGLLGVNEKRLAVHPWERRVVDRQHHVEQLPHVVVTLPALQLHVEGGVHDPWCCYRQCLALLINPHLLTCLLYLLGTCMSSIRGPHLFDDEGRNHKYCGIRSLRSFRLVFVGAPFDGGSMRL